MSLRKNQSIQLDFTLVSAEERRAYIDQLLNQLNSQNYSPTASELELFSNYILYGKEADGKSPVEKKDIEIETRYKTYQRKKDKSLDELMEMPGFREDIFHGDAPPYKVPKYKLDRSDFEGIPAFEELWSQIDEIETLLKTGCAPSKQDGLQAPHKARALEFTTQQTVEEAEAAKKLTPQQIYKLKHLLVELRREQYTLKDFYRPQIQQHIGSQIYSPSETAIPWQQGIYEIAPLGLYHKGMKRFEKPREADKEGDYHWNEGAPFVLDFRNEEHIYALCENWLELETQAEDDPESTLRPLLDTLDFYIQGAPLNEEQRDVLYYKIHRMPNIEIARIINQKYETSHSDNYISTMYKQKICKIIADYAALHYDEYLARTDRFKWKKCSYCGKEKLRDPRNFVRKTKSSDGLSGRCKECDKRARLGEF